MCPTELICALTLKLTYERLLYKLNGQNFGAVTVISNLVRFNINEQGFCCAHYPYCARNEQLVSWCFEPSQPHRITSGLKKEQDSK